MSMMQMLLNTPQSPSSGTYFFWRIITNDLGSNNLYAKFFSFVSGVTSYPPNMTSNVLPSPYVASNSPTANGNPTGSWAYYLFNSNASLIPAWSNSSAPVVVTLFTSTALAKPTSVSAGIPSIPSARQGWRDLDFLMGNTSNINDATLLLSIRGQLWTNSTAETRTFTIP